MKKKKLEKKLILPTETIRLLDAPELAEVVGGARTDTCTCPSCGNRHSTCPV